MRKKNNCYALQNTSQHLKRELQSGGKSARNVCKSLCQIHEGRGGRGADLWQDIEVSFPFSVFSLLTTLAFLFLHCHLHLDIKDFFCKTNAVGWRTERAGEKYRGGLHRDGRSQEHHQVQQLIYNLYNTFKMDTVYSTVHCTVYVQGKKMITLHNSQKHA